ncbi:MAG: HipA N-terminal domain-containing protein [Coriobacteriia bacterium]|nr:HipA N-terminal domain-containing protein [Coriobacteriia bacterium]
MAKAELSVLVCGKVVGTLHQDAHGLMSFSYRAEYQGIPLSLNMPISNRVFDQATVRPYLFGPLPDSEQQRRAIASEYGVSANNPIELLKHIGLDCPGAVQFCLPGKETEAVARTEGPSNGTLVRTTRRYARQWNVSG